VLERIWCFEDYAAFAAHEDKLVRRWAVERLRVQYPRRCVPVLLERLHDPDWRVADQAAQGLEVPSELDVIPALMAFWERSERRVTAGRLLAASWDPRAQGILERSRVEGNDRMATAGLIRLDGPEGVSGWLARGRHFGPVASALEVSEILDWIVTPLNDGGRAGALEELEHWIPRGDDLTVPQREGLLAASDDQLASVALATARAVLEARGVTPSPPYAPDSYAWRAAAALAVLETLSDAGRAADHGLALAALCAVLWERDDQATIRTAADPDEAALAALGSERRRVWEGVVPAVVGQGASALPRLIAIAQNPASYWGAVRAVQALTQIARAAPGSCDAAVPALVEALIRDDGDHLFQPAQEALAAIGAPAVAALQRALEADQDGHAEIVVLGTLEQIPTEAAWAAVAEHVERSGFWDEMSIVAAQGIGSAAALAPLEEAWSPGNTLVGEALIVLSTVHGRAVEERERWRRDLNEARVRQRRHEASIAKDLVALFSGQSPPRMAGATRKKVSPEERKAKRLRQKQARKARRKKGRKRR